MTTSQKRVAPCVAPIAGPIASRPYSCRMRRSSLLALALALALCAGLHTADARGRRGSRKHEAEEVKKKAEQEAKKAAAAKKPKFIPAVPVLVTQVNASFSIEDACEGTTETEDKDAGAAISGEPIMIGGICAIAFLDSHDPKHLDHLAELALVAKKRADAVNFQQMAPTLLSATQNSVVIPIAWVDSASQGAFAEAFAITNLPSLVAWDYLSDEGNFGQLSQDFTKREIAKFLESSIRFKKKYVSLGHNTLGELPDLVNATETVEKLEEVDLSELMSLELEEVGVPQCSLSGQPSRSVGGADVRIACGVLPGMHPPHQLGLILE